MRRALVALFVAVAALTVPSIGSATWTPEEQERCSSGDNAGPIHVEAAFYGSDSGYITACNDDADFPLEGNISADGDVSQMCGTGSIDGDPENPDVDLGSDGEGDLDGYAALEVDADGATPVGIENYGGGDYESDCVGD